MISVSYRKMRVRIKYLCCMSIINLLPGIKFYLDQHAKTRQKRTILLYQIALALLPQCYDDKDQPRSIFNLQS